MQEIRKPAKSRGARPKYRPADARVPEWKDRSGKIRKKFCRKFLRWFAARRDRENAARQFNDEFDVLILTAGRIQAILENDRPADYFDKNAVEKRDGQRDLHAMNLVFDTENTPLRWN